MRAGIRGTWVWLLGLFTVASFVEAAFWSQVNRSPRYRDVLTGPPSSRVFPLAAALTLVGVLALYAAERQTVARPCTPS